MSLIALARRLLLPTAVIGAALAIAGCAAPVFRDTSGVVAIAPLDVQASPSRFHGARVLWGGRIVAISLVPGASEVEVLAYPLDRDLQPRPDLPPLGRFILILPSLADPSVYAAGRHLSVLGQIAGVRHIEQPNYDFPMLEASEVNVWPWGFMLDKRPNIRVGVGARSLRGRMNSKRNGADAIQWINRRVRIAGTMQA